MRKLLLAVVLVVGVCGVAFGAVPEITLGTVYYDDDSGTIQDIEAIEPYRKVIFPFGLKVDVQPVNYTITSGASVSAGRMLIVGAPLKIDYDTSFSSNESKTITITVMDATGRTNSLTIGAKAGPCKVKGIDLKDLSDSSNTGNNISITLNIYKNEKKQIEAIVQPENADNKIVSWASNNEAVATIDSEGWIEGHSVGAAEITATTEDGEFNAVCNVTVIQNADPVIELSSAIYTDDNSAITNFSAIEPYRETKFTYTIASEHNSVTYSGTLSTGNETRTLSGSVEETPLEITILKEFAALESGKIILNVTDTNGNGHIETSVTAKDGTRPVIPVTGITLRVGTSGTPANTVSVTLSSNKKETCTLTPIVTPENATNKKVTWKTSDSVVAKVDDNGKVEAGAVGTAVITATTENGGLKATCNVTVVKDASTEEIVLDPKELTLKVGETKRIEASFSDAWGWADVEWRTEESDIAKIDPLLDACYVTGVSAGTTNIVATLDDVSAVCKVTVTSATPVVPTTPTTSDDISVSTPTTSDDIDIPTPTSPDDPVATTPGGSTPTTPTNPVTPPSGETPESGSDSGGGGGCNTGFLALSLAALGIGVFRKDK